MLENYLVVLTNTCLARRQLSFSKALECLASEAVDGSALSLQRVDNIQSCHSLSSCVLAVSDGVFHNTFQEALQDRSSFFVDESGNSLDSTSSSKTSDGWLSDAIDVISQHSLVTFGTAFAKSFSAFSSSGNHCLLCFLLK